jgi:hypothetical protein
MRKTALMAIIIISAVGLGFAQETAKAPDRKPADVKYTDNSFARLSFLDGKAFIQRASDLAYEDLLVNTPIAAGDRLGTAEGRVEIFLGRKNYLRLDENTKIDVLALPKKDAGVTRLRGWAGSVYLDINGMAKEKEIEFLTSDATFYFLENGVYRIDVRENKETEILVFSGVVEASGEEGSVLVKKDQRLIVSDGRFQGKPGSFFAAPDDAFDRFNDSRDTKVGRQVARKYLSGDLEDYEGELDENGDWVYENPFGYVWVPRGMAGDWMPYTNGRWTWLPMAGWSWLPYESWGWSTYHYGRWHWGMNRGWYWIPMSGWGPGWVNWWWNDDYYGWAPMSYWGYPGVIIDNFYYGRGWRDYRDYPMNSRALTVVRKDQLMARDIHAVALKNDAIRSIGKMSLNERTPDIRPASSPRISTESLGGGGRVILRNGGESGTSGKAAGSGSKGTLNPRGRDTGATQGGGDRKIDPKSTSGSGSGKTVEPTKKGESAPPAKSSPPPERRIRKKIEEYAPNTSGGSGRTAVLGYPSRMTDPQGTVSRNGARQDSGSVLDRLYRSITGGSGSSSSRGTVNRGSSSSGSKSVSSAPRAMPRISSSTSSSSSRGSSSSSSPRSSSGSSSSGRSSGGGGVRKK